MSGDDIKLFKNSHCKSGKLENYISSSIPLSGSGLDRMIAEDVAKNVGVELDMYDFGRGEDERNYGYIFSSMVKDEETEKSKEKVTKAVLEYKSRLAKLVQLSKE